jgi:hypothetical protein
MLKVVRRFNPDDADPCNDLPEELMGMHWSTHDRLVERYEAKPSTFKVQTLRL